jgi:hypothetical protein
MMGNQSCFISGLMTCLEDEEEEMVAFNSLVFMFLVYVY